jgi:hypothetical protein
MPSYVVPGEARRRFAHCQNPLRTDIVAVIHVLHGHVAREGRGNSGRKGRLFRGPAGRVRKLARTVNLRVLSPRCSVVPDPLPTPDPIQ